MAQVVVDSQVMRDKAEVIKQAAKNMLDKYNEMLQEVQTTAGKMKGTTIETQRQKFEGMKANFETFTTDIEAYANFLNRAADAYDNAENKGTQQAEAQGIRF